MFQERDGEKEILLGNKQLIGIFFVLAILLAVVFTAGYMVGKGTIDRKALAETAAPEAAKIASASDKPEANGTTSSGETHAVSPDPAVAETPPSAATSHTVPAAPSSSEVILGARNPKKATPAKPEPTRAELEQEPPASPATAPLAPPPGHNTYLQVAALAKNDAESVAKVLRKKGFPAHIAPKTGTAYYRVLVGPMRDAGELNTTRDALKSKEGFREVFVQHL